MDESHKKKRKQDSVASEKSSKKQRKNEQSSSDTFLSASKSTLDQNLAALFATTTEPVSAENLLLPVKKVTKSSKLSRGQASQVIEGSETVPTNGERDESLNVNVDKEAKSGKGNNGGEIDDTRPVKRRKKQRDAHEDLESNYLKKLARENEKLVKEDRVATSNVTDAADTVAGDLEDLEKEGEGGASEDDIVDDVSQEPYDIPVHESMQAMPTDDALRQAQQTVFLGNVSTECIKVKSARRTLENHLTSFFSALPAPKANSSTTTDTSTSPKPALLSLRFRSTPFATAIPKRAAFAKKEVMDATSHSTNAYAVYSSSNLAREAVNRLNNTMVLDRHLRVDSVAHPSPVDHRRCVFVGNLGFVDDESAIDAANADEGRGARKGKKTPSDSEEGLWRFFGKCGKVESVRVVRDAKTRVGKGFAYVQFEDEIAVEQALLLDGQRDPPMLPRKLRVMRAKSMKRREIKTNAMTRAKSEGKGRLTPQQQSQMGRAAKLFGKQAASARANGRMGDNGQTRNDRSERQAQQAESSFKSPESFVFEGHRAKPGSGTSGLKVKHRKPALATKSGKKRGAAWRAKQSK